MFRTVVVGWRTGTFSGLIKTDGPPAALAPGGEHGGGDLRHLQDCHWRGDQREVPAGHGQ